MHRLAALPGSTADPAVVTFVEQPPAPVLLLSSADTDLRCVDQLLLREPGLLPTPLRGLNLRALEHPAVLDHYMASTACSARLVVVRLLGGRGHWSYGLEQLQLWSQAAPGRILLMLAGTGDEERSLAELSSVDPALAVALARCFREGGEANLRQVLTALAQLLEGTPPTPPAVSPLPDPLPHDWRDDPGARVGLILYRSWLQADDVALMEEALGALRGQGLCPRALWVSGLRDPAVQRGVADLLQREQVQAVLSATGFATVQFEEAGLGSPLWEQLGVPVFQLLCSSQSRQCWERSSIGLAPTDLSLQVVLPELDGRLTTRIGAFKEVSGRSDPLASALHRYQPDPERLQWIAELCGRWIDLRHTPAGQRRVALVLANYPNRNSRVANGVGLDTPASVAAMLGWLEGAGYGLEGPLPRDGQELIEMLLAGLSNDPESAHRPALDHLPLSLYGQWYAGLPDQARRCLEERWGPPDLDPGLVTQPEGAAFPIRGLRFGAITLLLQPERGYDRDPALSYHSPDLPPTHAYLAQYLWIRAVQRAQVVVHVGKHGNLEWLPGKGLGLSPSCFPDLALGPLPHLYPFIVNDPGEGSQAKRRAQAVILDHLTPPLGRAGLHGELLQLEGLLDEYWQAQDLGSERTEPLLQRLNGELDRLQLPLGGSASGQPLLRLQAADGYLCELKESQIRLGLHTFGSLPGPELLAELLLCLARAPQGGLPGITQALAQGLGLELDPWIDAEDQPLAEADRGRFLSHGVSAARGWRQGGDAVAWLEEQALVLCRQLVDGWPPQESPPGCAGVLGHLQAVLLPRLLACGRAEREAFLAGLEGQRIPAGPAGAPTRGRSDLLPTGRNFYSVDLRGLPTEAAWDLGRRSAELLLELHRQEQGEPLRTLALSVWGTSTMRNGGEDIAQALALLGVRPVWDGPTRRLVDLELIPPELLGRPRVDVTLRISGLFRDAFPQLVSLFQRATALVAALPEPPELNPLAATAAGDGHCRRVYGSAPGAYGAGLQGLIDSGHWETRRDLAEAYLSWSSWSYSDASDAAGIEGQADRAGLEERLSRVQVVLHNQDNREHDLLDSDDYYQFQGGLSAAVESLSGQAPALWFGDHSRGARPRLHRLEKEFDKVLRSRVLNPRWIQAMQRHGYKGGFEMAASLDYLFAYDASTGRVPDWSYGAIHDQWLNNPEVCAFLEQNNPWALRDMAERLLEAHHRGLWEGALPQQLGSLRQLVLQSESLIEQR